MSPALPTALLPVTIPLSWLYRAALALRNRRYERGLSPVGTLPAPVVSVGNVTLGGSGKTPVVAAICRILAARGKSVGVLSRGHGRRSRSPYVLVSDGERVTASVEESGDEPLELARALPGVAVAVGADRLEAGRRLHQHLRPDLFLLDDGFQHRRLHRDLDLVCIDSGEDPSSLRLLPAGRLREPLSSIGRAHAVLWTGWSEERSADELRSLLPASIQEIRTRSRTLRLTRLDSAREELPGDAFRDQPVGLVLGIARPDRVRKSVPARVVCSSVRGDHHWWRADEVHAFARKAKGMGAVALLTTGKDSVKMGFLAEGAGPGLPVFAIEQEVEILDRAAFEKLLGVFLTL